MNIGIDFDRFKKQETTLVMSNYTKTPNSIIDDLVMAQVSDKAFKCLVFIMRQTVGFNRESHTIAITQFQKYCGIKKRDTVMTAIRELEQCKLITVERKTGCLNEYCLTINQYHQTGLVPIDGSTAKRDGTSTVKGDGTSTVKRDTIKETLKENFKEIHTIKNPQKNSVDEVLSLWTPDLHSLNSWLQRSGEKAMTQEEVNLLLPEINAHYEDRIKSGVATNTKMYANFVKWVKGDFSKYRGQNSNKPTQPHQSVKQQREQAWADYYAKRNQQQPNNIIDVIEVQHD
ncbi:replication protein [Acinetobacter towneri]|uniref:replication protein n=1 Tax=Acinetobacter towneri TaxID=202956 RepID=UPI0029343125|nr:replication protein [Acinetobacter towneri]WOE29704.1 replication protein [Acinetobacter towneri]